MMRFPLKKYLQIRWSAASMVSFSRTTTIDSLLRLNGTPHFQKPLDCRGGIAGASQEAARHGRDAPFEISEGDAGGASRPHACRVESYNARHRNETERNR